MEIKNLTFEKCREEIAFSYGKPTWSALVNDADSRNGRDVYDKQVAQTYAQFVAQDALNRAADGAMIRHYKWKDPEATGQLVTLQVANAFHNPKHFIGIEKSSITETEIITL